MGQLTEQPWLVQGDPGMGERAKCLHQAQTALLQFLPSPHSIQHRVENGLPLTFLRIELFSTTSSCVTATQLHKTRSCDISSTI